MSAEKAQNDDYVVNVQDGEGMTDWLIEEEELLADIGLLVKDYFVATYESRRGSLSIKFLNGQKFDLKVSNAS